MSSRHLRWLNRGKADRQDSPPDYGSKLLEAIPLEAEIEVCKDGPSTSMELTTYDSVKLKRATIFYFVAGLAILLGSFAGLASTGIPIFAVVMLAVPITAVVLERRLYRRGRSLRIYTDEIQLRQGGEILAAVPWSEVSTFSERSNKISQGHEIEVALADGEVWKFQMLGPAIKVMRAGLRLLAPDYCRILVKHRPVVKNPLAILQGLTALTAVLMLPFFIPPLAGFTPVSALLLLTIPAMFLCMTELKNKDLVFDWELRHSARSATDLLKILPIMDSEYHVFRYGKPERLHSRLTQMKKLIWPIRAVVIALLFSAVLTVVTVQSASSLVMLPIAGTLLALVLLFCETHLTHLKEEERLADARLIIKNQKAYLELDGEVEECSLTTHKRAFSSASEWMRLKCGKREFLVQPNHMMESDWLETHQAPPKLPNGKASSRWMQPWQASEKKEDGDDPAVSAKA